MPGRSLPRPRVISRHGNRSLAALRALPAVAALLAAAIISAAISPIAQAADKPGYHIVDRIPLTDGWWDYASIEPVHGNLFITRGNGVFKMDLNTGLMDQHFIPGSEGRGIIALPGGNTAIAVLAGNSSAIMFNTDDEGKVLQKFSLVQQSDSAVYEPAARQVWLMGGHGQIAIVDPAKQEQTASIEVGGELEFSQTDGRGRVFVNEVQSGSIIAIDAATHKVIGRWKMKDCEAPTGMAYVEHADVLLSVCFNNMLKVIDARSGKELLTVPVGKGADAVIYDKSTHRAFVPSAYDGVLTVLQVNGPTDVQVLEQVPTQVGTRTGAIDSRNGTLYMPTARFGPFNKAGDVEPLPGTVQLLVMKPQN